MKVCARHWLKILLKTLYSLCTGPSECHIILRIPIYPNWKINNINIRIKLILHCLCQKSKLASEQLCQSSNLANKELNCIQLNLGLFNVGANIVGKFQMSHLFSPLSAEKFTEVLEKQRKEKAERERQRILMLNADPFDPNAQSKIAEAIRYSMIMIIRLTSKKWNYSVTPLQRGLWDHENYLVRSGVSLYSVNSPTRYINNDPWDREILFVISSH